MISASLIAYDTKIQFFQKPDCLHLNFHMSFQLKK